VRTEGRATRWTDRHDTANSHVSQFCERAYKATQTWLDHVWSPGVPVVSYSRLVACVVNTMVSVVHVTLLPLRHVLLKNNLNFVILLL
jgi:hypothetical protein